MSLLKTFVLIQIILINPSSAEVYQNLKFGVIFGVPKGFRVSEQAVRAPKPNSKDVKIPISVPLSYNSIRITELEGEATELNRSLTLIVERSFLFELGRTALKAKKDLDFKTEDFSLGPWKVSKWLYFPNHFGFSAFVYTFAISKSKEVGIFGPRLLDKNGNLEKNQPYEEAAKYIIKTLSAPESE